VNLRVELKAESGLIYLFIVHCINVIKSVFDRIGIMDLGKVTYKTKGVSQKNEASPQICLQCKNWVPQNPAFAL